MAGQRIGAENRVQTACADLGVAASATPDLGGRCSFRAIIFPHAAIEQAFRAILAGSYKKASPIPLWDGRAAERAAAAIQRWIDARDNADQILRPRNIRVFISVIMTDVGAHIDRHRDHSDAFASILKSLLRSIGHGTVAERL